MSRVGKLPVKKPDGVTISLGNNEITVKGPKGELSQFMMPGIRLKEEADEIIISRDTDEPEHRSKHGLMRALVANMVEGVSRGFERKLEVNGVGFRVSMAGSDIKMNLGFSHEVIYKIPEGVQAQVQQNVITITGISKQKVGQVAAEIRALKKPEPYKGKGIKYVDERILRKSGKSGKDK
mgnify:CR=1 FL=1